MGLNEQFNEAYDSKSRSFDSGSSSSATHGNKKKSISGGETVPSSSSNIDIDTTKLQQVHSQLELLLDGLRVDDGRGGDGGGDGAGKASSGSDVIHAIRNGDSLESVLAIATKVVQRRQAESH